MDYYYSTQPYLARCINRDCYGQHYLYVAEEFHPYRFPNPKSSNPYHIYRDLYEPWRDRDEYDKFILQLRLNLRNGVGAKEKAGTITHAQSRRLKRICDKIDVMFFYPIVYRVLRSGVAGRTKRAGSGATGSAEWLIEDLVEAEFDLLFDDFTGDSDLNAVRTPAASINSLLTLLEGRC